MNRILFAALVLAGCGRSNLDDTRGCLLLGTARREMGTERVRVDFGVDHLVNVHADQMAYVWSTVAELSDGPRRVLSTGKGTDTEAPYITYSEPGGPATGAVFVDLGVHACESLTPPDHPDTHPTEVGNVP